MDPDFEDMVEELALETDASVSQMSSEQLKKQIELARQKETKTKIGVYTLRGKKSLDTLAKSLPPELREEMGISSSSSSSSSMDPAPSLHEQQVSLGNFLCLCPVFRSCLTVGFPGDFR
jgi:hypothetical protein